MSCLKECQDLPDSVARWVNGPTLLERQENYAHSQTSRAGEKCPAIGDRAHAYSRPSVWRGREGPGMKVSPEERFAVTQQAQRANRPLDPSTASRHGRRRGANRSDPCRCWHCVLPTAIRRGEMVQLCPFARLLGHGRAETATESRWKASVVQVTCTWLKPQFSIYTY